MNQWSDEETHRTSSSLVEVGAQYHGTREHSSFPTSKLFTPAFGFSWKLLYRGMID